MTCLSFSGSGWYSCLVLIILVSLLGQNKLEKLNGVLAAPQKIAEGGSNLTEVGLDAAAATDGTAKQPSNIVADGHQKTADLTLLINETLKINNKSVVEETPLTGDKPNFRDDWTFDRVEYDLMDFLQELNARYQYTNKSQPTKEDSESRKSQSDENDLQARKNLTDPTHGTQEASKEKQASPLNPVDQRETVTKTTIEAVKKELEEDEKLAATSSSVLPISLAGNDHDISESTWQYGIFDRFTRPRASSTTQSPDTLSASGSNVNLDLKLFNSDECGLRTYRNEPDYYPLAAPTGAEAADTDEMTKELSQRRQRPPLSSFFSSHKKFQHTGSTGDTLVDDELLRDHPLDSLPPFDRYGEPAIISSSAASPQESNTAKYHKAQAAAAGSNVGSTHSSSVPSNDGQDDRGSSQADSEFNLAIRRQWLQQQLGSTLQMLGLNTNGTHLLTLSDNINKTGPTRENMMKMSANRNNKVGKSYSSGANPEVPSSPTIQAGKSDPEVSEQDLKARQDELKLEARVIGGNDARLGDSPWSASLQALVSRPGTGGVEYRHYCGGTIISEYYILTAAHCLDFMVGRESRLFVVVGDLNWRMSAASMYGRRFGIEKLIIHGGYKSTAFGHDIGLIKTKESMKPLKVNGRYIINSVCLPEKNVEHTGEAELVGWGLFSNRNEMADSLQIADVPILPRPLCVDLYRRRTGLIQWLIGIELITEKQVCAGTFGRGICQGDSGSALVFNEKVHVGQNDRGPSVAGSGRPKSNMARDQQQRATIIGVVAFGGIRRCSYQSLPGVYMQTSKYLDWILPRIQ